MSIQQKIDRITDILRRDDGISGAMHYTEQISWILFLRYLDSYEQKKAQEALIDGTTYHYVIEEKYRWNTWACPKDENDKLDHKKALTSSDLKDFVNEELFPYLKAFNNANQDSKSLQYKIGAIFDYLDNRIANGSTLREVLDIIDELEFNSSKGTFELSNIYERLLKGMGADGGNSGEFYTPRPVTKIMVECLAPTIGQTVYDGAVGTGGFLIQAFEYLREKTSKTGDLEQLQYHTFFGNEKTPLAYIMCMMNLILHGMESPNITKTNTLTANIRDVQEKDRHDIILANPPFGGKEKDQIQANFPIKSNATELLFMQHFMKKLKSGGKAAIVVPEGVLFQTNKAFQAVKKSLLEDFNLHTIVSLPAGVFLPYSGVKTNVIFFEKTGSTSDIWYYELTPPSKLTKNKPIKYEHFKEFLSLYSHRTDSDHSWTVKATDIEDFDIAAKNPKAQEAEVLESPDFYLKGIQKNDKKIADLLNEVNALMND